MELCQSIHDFRNPSNRNTAQILTRRLYLHPLTINTSSKTHAPKVQSHGHVETDALMINQKHTIKHRSHGDLTVHSSSVPLLNRNNPKVNISVTAEEESTHDFETSITSFSINQLTLPSVVTRKTTPSIKRTLSTRPLQLFQQKRIKPARQRQGKVDVWRQLAHTLERPIPSDPPTTPFTQLNDFDFENLAFDEQSTNNSPRYYSRQEIKASKDLSRRNSMFDNSHHYSRL